MKKKIFVFIRLSVTIAIFFVLFKFISYAQLVAMYRESQKVYLFLAFAIFVSNYIVGILRWRFLLSCVGVAISAKEVFYVSLSGLFLNLFFPSFVAGDIFRGASIGYRYGGHAKIASSILMDRFSGAVALAIIAIVAACLGMPFIKNEPSVFISLIVLCGIIGVVALFIFTKSFFNLSLAFAGKFRGLYHKITSFHEQLSFFKKQPEVLFKIILFFSLPLQLLMIAGFFIAAKAFHVETGISYFFIMVPIIAAVATIPVTIAGAGTREAAAVYFFSLIGIERSIGLSISFVNLLSIIAVGIAGGIVYASVYHRYLERGQQGATVKDS